jgi:hypothetical protein
LILGNSTNKPKNLKITWNLITCAPFNPGYPKNYKNKINTQQKINLAVP